METTIMVIDDNEKLRSNVVELLDMEGFTVIEANNGGQALGILQRAMPDLVLCDINMPDFSGYQILQHIRKSKVLSTLPFLFLTARNDRKSMRRGMDLGADDYLLKPFSDKELLSAIRSRLNRHQALVTSQQEQLDKAKTQLTRVVAHELRTPLVPLVTISQIISNKVEALSQEQIEDLLTSWSSGANRLRHLTEQMIFLTQIDAGVLTEESIKADEEHRNIKSLLQSATSTARQYAHRHPEGRIITSFSNESLSIKCHSQSLQHALAEIITNALDFSEDDTTVLIKQVQYGQSVQFSITDNGPGMTTRRLGRALLPFEQIDREKREQQGIGLGLPVAKKIIELHGGNILFQHTVAGGTQVIIQIPTGCSPQRSNN